MHGAKWGAQGHSSSVTAAPAPGLAGSAGFSCPRAAGHLQKLEEIMNGSSNGTKTWNDFFLSGATNQPEQSSPAMVKCEDPPLSALCHHHSDPRPLLPAPAELTGLSCPLRDACSSIGSVLSLEPAESVKSWPSSSAGWTSLASASVAGSISAPSVGSRSTQSLR